MRIHEFVWPQERIDHIARHGVTPEEVEDVCFGDPLVQRAKSEGENPVYYLLGQTRTGRYLFCVVIAFPDGKGLPGDGATHDTERETLVPAAEAIMSSQRLPKTDSIEELATFWDTHDLTDFEDQLEEVTESVFERDGTPRISDTSLIGRAKELEVAGMLIRNGIYVFWPLVDTGADLLATNRDASRCIPVQVKYVATGASLNLTKADKERFEKPNTVVAFVIGKSKQRFWFVPFDEWYTKKIDRNRRDGLIYVRIKDDPVWLSQFEGDAGIRRAFSPLLPSTA